MKTTILTTTAALALAATPLLAAPAVVATDLNLRAGPGPNYTIQSVLPAEASVEVTGCVEGGSWCQVTYEGATGYAYAPYLVTQQDDTYTQLEVSSVETVTYDENVGDEALIGGTVGGAIAATVLGGPAAIAGGVLLGSLAGATTAEPEVQTVTYVRENPTEPVFVQGEPLIGATIPAEVELVSVPESEYLYGNLNGQLVLVNPDDRAIVYIVE